MAKAAEPASLLVVRTAFAAEGELYREGEVIEADHWAVKKWPEFFCPLTFPHPVKRAQPRIEQATAAPGEKRGA